MIRTFALLVITMASATTLANPVVEGLLHQYTQTGTKVFDAGLGETLWYSNNDDRSCTSCHGESPSATGKHQRTGKKIEPMAPSINPARLTDPQKIEKWFLRNCKWTLGRACSSEEKGNLLQWLSHQ